MIEALRISISKSLQSPTLFFFRLLSLLGTLFSASVLSVSVQTRVLGFWENKKTLILLLSFHPTFVERKFFTPQCKAARRASSVWCGVVAWELTFGEPENIQQEDDTFVKADEFLHILK